MKKQKAEKAIAVMAVFLFEMLATAVTTAMFGALIIPLAYAKRGYYAVGGEWMFLMMVALVAYHLLHWRLFASIEKGGKKNGRSRCTRKQLSGRRSSERVMRSVSRNGVAKTEMDY